MVVELSPLTIRARIVGNPRATKIEVAEAPVGSGFDQLRQLVPRRPARPALGLRPRDKYWLHMFDALALAFAAGTSTAERTQFDHVRRANSGVGSPARLTPEP